LIRYDTSCGLLAMSYEPLLLSCYSLEGLNFLSIKT
jgi:hypothetical protein